MEHLWKYWINEPIFMDSGVSNILKRKYAIYDFCTKGLIPFIQQRGYRFQFNDNQVFKNVLQLLFVYFQGKRAQPYLLEDDYIQEQYDNYEYIFDTDSWNHFWKRWEGLQDFQEDAFGYPLKILLSEFVWSWIELDISPAAIKLREALEENEIYEEGSKGKEDPYLVETSKRDYDDRHKH